MIRKYYDILPSEGGKGSGMSKEDILDGYESTRVCYGPDDHEYMWPRGCIEQAMDQFAKQESIEFAKWMCKEGYDSVQIAVDPRWTKGFNQPEYTPEELYNLFTEQRNIKG